MGFPLVERLERTGAGDEPAVADESRVLLPVLIENRPQLVLRRGAGETVGGDVDAARQAERLVAASKWVAAVDEDGRRAAEADRLGLFVGLDQHPLGGRTPLGQNPVEAFGSSRPVGTVVEVEQFDRHSTTLNLPECWKVKGVLPVKIGELAAASGVPAKTIRFWESTGLVPEPLRTPSGYRDYSAETADRLAFIRRSQAAGFTLGQIRQVLDISDGGEPPCEHVAALVADRLAEVEARLRELRATKRTLLELSARAASQDPADCEGFCSILADG